VKALATEPGIGHLQALALETMGEPHIFYWRNKLSDYVVGSVVIATVVGVFFVIEVSYAYLGLAVATGVVLGIADAWLYLGERGRGLRVLTFFLWFMAELVAREQNVLKRSHWEEYVGAFQFLMLAGFTAAVIVQLKERITRRNEPANKSPEPTPGSVTPAASAPVVPPPSAAQL